MSVLAVPPRRHQDLVGGRGRPVPEQVRVRRRALARHGQARLGVDRLVVHQAHEPAHALFVDGVAGQAQVVAQAEHALEVVPGEFLVEQAHQGQVLGAFAAGPVVEAAAGQPQGLATGGHRARDRVGRLDQGALLGYRHGPSVFFSSAFSICSRPMAA